MKVMWNRSNKKPLRWEWILAIASAVILTSFYMYTDIADTTAQGIKFWNCFFGDGINEFYNRPYLDGVEDSVLWKAGGGAYDFILYAIFAVYDFPLWVWEKLSGVGFSAHYITRWYAQGIVWVFSGVSAYLLYKIALICEMDEDEARWASLLFITSPLFFFTEVVIGGYDIISVAFSLLGIYGYMKKNNRVFVWAFALAVTAKLFALWIFIPLLLLREKKIWKIFVGGIESISLVMIPRIFFAVQKHYRALSVVAEEIIVQNNVESEVPAEAEATVSELFSNASSIIGEAIFPAGTRAAEYTILTMDNLPLLFVGMIIIWVWCYISKKELNNRQVITLCAVSMGVFTLTVKLHPHWMILLVPYIVLLILFKPNRMRENLIIECVFSCGYILNKAYGYFWTCNMNLIDNMFRPQHHFSFSSEDADASSYGLSHYLYILFQKVGIADYNIMRLGSGMVVAGVALFVIMNYYWNKEGSITADLDYAQRRKWLTVRFILSCLVGMLPMVGLMQYLF